jgi:hypothetical protein
MGPGVVRPVAHRSDAPGPLSSRTKVVDESAAVAGPSLKVVTSPAGSEC